MWLVCRIHPKVTKNSACSRSPLLKLCVAIVSLDICPVNPITSSHQRDGCLSGHYNGGSVTLHILYGQTFFGLILTPIRTGECQHRIYCNSPHRVECAWGFSFHIFI